MIRELSATILLTTANTKLVSVIIYDLNESGDLGAISVLGMTLLVVSFAVVLVANRLPVLGGQRQAARMPARLIADAIRAAFIRDHSAERGREQHSRGLDRGTVAFQLAVRRGRPSANRCATEPLRRGSWPIAPRVGRARRIRPGEVQRVAPDARSRPRDGCETHCAGAAASLIRDRHVARTRFVEAQVESG